RDGVGARVELAVGGRMQVRVRRAGGAYLSGHDPRLFFGLGEGDAEPVRIRVRWPSGTVEESLGAGRDRVVEVEEGRFGP
ncbi:MAG: ASPIC/UnbV domain-containing protein, partial [Planctomycetes bacterium]|nr:ASPIC/UnbV domain-containing protein [Planctomycetota bacterium]